jgi:class III poly(R)-hydroxyalkanoic acid synthase PhaE subunit
MSDKSASGKTGSGNPWLDAWMAGQQQFLKAQEPLATSMKAMMGGEDLSEAMHRAQANWELCNKQAADWVKSTRHWMTGDRGVGSEKDGVAEETLRRMLDPSRFLYAGSDEVNQAIQRLVEGPEFADIGTLERQVLKATSEWFALREASAAYRVVTAAAWSRAFETFSKEMMANPSVMSQGTRPVLDRWLAIANEELIRTQRTDAFLDAQRKLLRAGVEYRIKERELVEVWCETHSIPTRTEVDDLHRTVYGLNRRVRDLEKRLAEAEARPKQATPRRKPAAAKTK